MKAQKSTTSALPSSQPSVSETPTVTTTSTPRPPPDTDGEDEAPSDAEDEDEMDVDGELPTSKATASKRYETQKCLGSLHF